MVRESPEDHETNLPQALGEFKGEGSREGSGAGEKRTCDLSNFL